VLLINDPARAVSIKKVDGQKESLREKLEKA